MAASGACRDPAWTWLKPRLDRTKTSQSPQAPLSVASEVVEPIGRDWVSTGSTPGLALVELVKTTGLGFWVSTGSTPELADAGISGLPCGLMLRIPSASLLTVSPHRRRLPR